jgi:hypothetical protein
LQVFYLHNPSKQEMTDNDHLFHNVEEHPRVENKSQEEQCEPLN